MRKRWRPPKPDDERKKQVTLRLSQDVLSAARETGSGWQARIDDVLRAAFTRNRTVSMADLGAAIVESTKRDSGAKLRGRSLTKLVALVTSPIGTISRSASEIPRAPRSEFRLGLTRQLRVECFHWQNPRSGVPAARNGCRRSHAFAPASAALNGSKGPSCLAERGTRPSLAPAGISSSGRIRQTS